MESNPGLLGLIIIFTITALNSKVSLNTESDPSINITPCNSSNQGDIQLVGGRDIYEGRVEVCYNGEWRTVCDRAWAREEAEVVCRQLGYPNASNAIHVRRGCAGQGTGEILQASLKASWQCAGNESGLLDCSMAVMEEVPECNHKRDAGVYCSGLREDNCDLRSLRLVNGPNNGSGRVEVCRFGCWGTVCDEGWDRYDANVACRQLGFETHNAIPTWGAYFGEGRVNRPILMSQVDCESSMNMSELLNCTNSGIEHQCLHDQDAGVICRGLSMCRDGDVRLVGGDSEREVRVEMCYNGVWGTVCVDGWSETAANIVCRQLGYENPELVLSPSQNTPGPVLFHNITCSETHSTLFQCVHLDTIGVYNCESTAGVISILIGSVGMAAVVIGLVAVIITLRMKRRRNSGSTSSALNDIAVPMTENEAYAPVHVSDTHHVKTLPNEAYGTLNY